MYYTAIMTSTLTKNKQRCEIPDIGTSEGTYFIITSKSFHLSFLNITWTGMNNSFPNFKIHSVYHITKSGPLLRQYAINYYNPKDRTKHWTVFRNVHECPCKITWAMQNDCGTRRKLSTDHPIPDAGRKVLSTKWLIHITLMCLQ